ncbi:hypothetical protein B0H19DRAFT_175321 [Mycena capillaripes]|nr:hypothetical protein B0H19DRAFT_175321 [Mycena capillaripes]
MIVDLSSSTIMSLSAFPPLPYDVVECILVHTSAVSPNAAATLCLVASWVRNSAIPQLFHAVMLGPYSDPTGKPEKSIPASPQAAYGSADAATIALGQHVRHLFVESYRADIYSVFPLCPHLHSLAISISRLLELYLFEPRLFPRLRRLTLFTNGLLANSNINLTISNWTNVARILPTLTHVHFHLLPPNGLPFDALPLLSHIAQPFPELGAHRFGPDDAAAMRDAAAIVQRCPALLMLVLTFGKDYDDNFTLSHRSGAKLYAHNSHIYVCPAPRAQFERRLWPRLHFADTGVRTEWRHDVDSGHDVWARAARFRETELSENTAITLFPKRFIRRKNFSTTNQNW